MHVIGHILWQNVIPLGIMIGIGVVLQRKFQLDLRTLSKLNFYLFSPAIIFRMLYESDISGAIIGQVLLFVFLLLVCLFGVVWLYAWIRRYHPGMRAAMVNSVLMYNSANYAIPLNQLVFLNNPFTLSVQIIVLMVQSLMPITFGIYTVNSHKMKLKQILRTIASMPSIYAIPLAFLFRGFDIPIPDPIYTPLAYVANAFLGTALVTLGIQIGAMKWQIRFSDVLASNVMRLLVGPAIAVGLVWLLGITGPMAQALVLSSAVPTSLSSLLIAVEFDNETEFSSQAVFASTVFSMATIAVVIYVIGLPMFA